MKIFFNKNRPIVGVAVIIKRKNKILLGKRKNNHGNGTWGLPGGHLEFNESIKVCVKCEVYEETNIYIKNIQYYSFTNDIFVEEKKHYITLFVTANYNYGILKLKEPDKCEQWNWFNINNLPKPKFLSFKNMLNQNFQIKENFLLKE